jgi:hypothetical protein
MEGQDKIELLKNLPNEVIGLSGMGSQHFTRPVQESEENGLSYMAGIIRPGMTVKALPHYGKEAGAVVFGKMDPVTEEWRESPMKIGSPEFMSQGFADAYVGSVCGCFVADNGIGNYIKEHVPTELLKYGHIFQSIDSATCMKNFLPYVATQAIGTGNESTLGDVEKRVRQFLDLGMKDRVALLRKMAQKELRLPGNLERRLHLIPSMRSANPFNE